MPSWRRWGRTWRRPAPPPSAERNPPPPPPPASGIGNIARPPSEIDKMRLDQRRRPAARWNGFADLDLLELHVNLASADEWINPDRSRKLLTELVRELEARGYVQDETTLAWRTDA